MKKIIFAFALFASAGAFQQADAQIRVSLNIGTQPVWGPTGYDYAQYYYMPEMGIYYDVQNSIYYYPNRGRWVSARTLPAQYSRYNLYNTYKVVLNERNPWMRDQAIRRQYGSFAKRHDQVVIRDSRDSRYWENANHPRHNEWSRQHDNNGRNDRRNGIDREADRSNPRGRR